VPAEATTGIEPVSRDRFELAWMTSSSARQRWAPARSHGGDELERRRARLAVDEPPPGRGLASRGMVDPQELELLQGSHPLLRAPTRSRRASS
jgi:hypothetical protein